ncbi:hypothetical protein [Jannaschia marina]|uniref:hypothetical protein n=1 Tax=Jannaschia marina TaxID=2741674 RepID=UPI0015CB68DD|nr:hypothetical protein [Jannaschia marina]
MILQARGIRAEWEPAVGHLPVLEIAGVQVLWSAPWRDDPSVQADATLHPVDRLLGGTFTCAPFGRDDVDCGPPHGLAANAPWHRLRAAPGALVACRRLSRGAITARIVLRDDHPVLYQTHLLDLDAPSTFAHHPILAAHGGGTVRSGADHLLTFAAEAPFLPQDTHLSPLVDVPTTAHEDFATLVGGPALGWTAVERHAEGDTILTLRKTRQLPVTNLWFSNGARGSMWALARGLICVEDAICAGAEGFAAALGRSRVGAAGVPTVLRRGRHVIPHALLRLDGCHTVEGVTLAPGCLGVQTARGLLKVPFDESHFA